MLKRYFISNIIIMLFANILVKPIWIFLIDRNVQLTVGHEEYGTYSALVSLTIMFNILLDLGITSMNNRNISANAEDMHHDLPNMMVAKLLLALLYTGTISVLAIIIGYQGRELYLLLLLAGVQMMNSFMQYLRSNVSANHDFKMDSLLSVLDKVLMVLICGHLLFTSENRSHFVLEWFIYAQLISYLLSIVVALVVIIRKYTHVDTSQISLTAVLHLCKKSLPYALLILLMGVYMRSDSIMLERLEGATENSYYAATYRILDIANMSGFLFAGILLPMFSRLISKGKDVKEILITSTNILGSISLAVVAFSMIYHHEIMILLYPKDAAVLGQLYQFTIASFPAFSLMYIFATLLTANGNISLLIKIAGFGSLLSLCLNYFLIKQFQAEGAALATLVVEWTLSGIYIFYALRHLKLKLQWSWFAKFILFLAIMYLINWSLHYFSISILIAIIVNSVVFFLVVYTIKLWDKLSIKSYLSQFKSAQ